MDRISRRFVLFLLIILLDSQTCHSWGWFSSSNSKEEKTNTDYSSFSRSHGSSSEFSMDVLSGDKNAVQRVEKAKQRQLAMGPNSCWQNAYSYIFSGCKEIAATEEKRKRFAWHLSDCFVKDSGRPAFPVCTDDSTMMSCLKKLDNHEHNIYLEFMFETNSICQQLQGNAFKNEIERLVNELKRSALYTEDKLDILERKSDVLVQSSSMIHDSLGGIDEKVQNVAEITNTMEIHMSGLSQQTTEIYQEQKSIAESQLELREGQEKMGETVKAGMEMFNDTVTNVKEGLDKLKDDTKQIEGEITVLGDSVSLKMNDLQSKTDDIGNMAVSSLDKQQKLLDGQSAALDNLQFLTRFQTEALQESRSTLQRLAEFSQEQQEELAKRQEQLQKVHDHLFENSKSMLAAQEAFEAKQASMFVALDKLFSLHNAMLLEARVIKAVFFYFLFIFVIYMFTSTKQTCIIRLRLYMGLCITLGLEVASMRYVNDSEHRVWIANRVRTLFAVLAAIQIGHAACTYKDLEVANRRTLLELVDKVNNMESKREISWDEDTESEVDWTSWIDTDIIDDADSLKDPDYKIPEEVKDNLSLTSSITQRLYNFRPR